MLDVKKLMGKRVLVVGDVTLDRFTVGKVTKISPEAPVPLLEVESEEFFLGAAANLINNIRSLGGETWVMSVVGDDPEGDYLIRKLRKLSVNVNGVIKNGKRITPVVHRVKTYQQQLLRIDRAENEEIPDELAETVLNQVSQILGDIDVVIIADYGRGVVTRKVIKGVVDEATRLNRVVVADPKRENFWNYGGVGIIRTNKLEASYVTGITPVNETSIRNMGLKIVNSLRCKVLITWIEEGFFLFDQNGRFKCISPLIEHPINTIGIGDAITSTLALGIASGFSLEDASRLANFAGEIVASRKEFRPVRLEELKKATERKSF